MNDDRQRNPERVRAWLISGALALVTFALFAPALGHEFLVYDDQQYVTENPHVLSGLSWQAVKWAFTSFYASNWHPLTWLSHMLDVQFYGLHAWGHHLTNVLFHVANVVLLFFALKSLTGKLWPSAVVAALFAWHPLHVESVAWVAERKDVFSTFFFLLMLLAWTRYVESLKGSSLNNRRSTIFYTLALFCFVLGLMSKPMVVTAPFVLLLLDFWPLQRMRATSGRGITIGRLLLEKAPFLLLSAIDSYVTVLAQGHSYSIVSSASLPLSQRTLHSPGAYVHYLVAAVVPRHLAVAYPYETTIPIWQIAVDAGVLLGVTLFVILMARRRPWLFVGWFWFLGTLVPVIGLVQVGDQAWADRYTYLPLIGLFIAVIWEMAHLVSVIDRRRRLPNTATAKRSVSFSPAAIFRTVAASLVLVLLAISTELQLRYWQNTQALFAHAAAVTHNNGRALAVLGSLLAKEGRVDEALPLYRQALVYKPHDPEAHFFLGNAFEQQGKFDEAIAEYQQVLWFRPLRERTHLALASVFSKQKNYAAAADQYRQALKINPDSAIAHNNLARLLHTEGVLDAAIEHYAAAIRLDPQLAQAHNNLGVLLLQKGRAAEGAAELREADRLRPNDPETRYNLALSLNQLGKWNEAADLLAKLAPAKPNDPEFHFQFGLALHHQGQTKEAMSHYARALLLRPQYPEALDRLSWILATDSHPEFRNGEEAVRMASAACELTQSKQPKMLITLAAAYAEAGRFSEAQETIQRAKQLLSTSEEKEMILKCDAVAESIAAQKPWREQ